MDTHSDTMLDLRDTLYRLRKQIESNDHSIHAIWMDEYGGMQSVKLGVTDRLELRKNAVKCDD